ncbi:hypothetical protein ACFO9E_27550 [Streptomyces maoxianensis]|uniref:DUF7224 domain-containing protein n=1 Tax=Streptomyces maoxianensis TaxID=1459942 RepID=A0ABV9GB43_9ACTN
MTMLLRTLLRTNSALIGLPLAVVFVTTALGDDLTSWVTGNYWPSVTGNATFALAFLSTGCAALGAWEGAQLDKGQVLAHTPVRSPLAISLPLLVPVIITGLVGTVVALVLTASAADVDWGLPDLSVLAAQLLLLTGNTLVGFLVGRRWTAVISVPGTLITAFIANAYPVSWDIMWPRHLVGGGLHNCCAVDQILDRNAVWSATLFALALSVAAAVIIQKPGSRRVLGVALLVVMLGIGAGGFFARDLSADPVRARPTASLVCEQGTAARVCLWPEVRNGETIRKETQKVLQRLTAAGVSVSPSFTMAAEPRAGEAKLAVLPGDDANQVAAGVVAGLMPAVPACAADHNYPAGAAREPVAAWLLLTSGTPADTVAAMVPPEAAQLAQQVARQPRSTQLSWYKHNAQAMHSCTTEPLLSAPRETT